MSGVAGMPLPDGHPDLQPCGTLAAYRRHLRDGLRGPQIDRACRQVMVRDWEDRVAAGLTRSRASVHLDGPGRCYRQDVAVTDDPGQVTCRQCLAGYRSLPWVRAAEQSRAA